MGNTQKYLSYTKNQTFESLLNYLNKPENENEKVRKRTQELYDATLKYREYVTNSAAFKEFYQSLVKTYQHQAKLVIHFLLQKINENDKYALVLFKSIYTRDKRRSGSSEVKVITNNMMNYLQFCLTYSLDTAFEYLLRFINTESLFNEIALLTLQKKNSKAFEMVLKYAKSLNLTDILPLTCANRDLTEDFKIAILPKLYNLHITSGDMCRAISAAMSNNEERLFDQLLLHPKVDMSAWTYDNIREALFANKWDYAAKLLEHKTCTPELLKNLLDGFYTGAIGGGSTVGAKILSERYKILTGEDYKLPLKANRLPSPSKFFKN